MREKIGLALEDGIAQRLRKLARQEGKYLNEVIEEALSKYLARKAGRKGGPSSSRKGGPSSKGVGSQKPHPPKAGK
jgi:Ribbon-helix-helix protein, copG family